MVAYQYGGKRGRRHTLAEREDLVVVRTRTRRSLGATPLSLKARRVLDGLERIVRFQHAGVEIFRYRPQVRGRAARRSARRILKAEPDTQFAGRVLAERGSGVPVLYTENFFVKFDDDARPSACRRLLARYGLAVKRELEYARNAWFVGAREGTGQKVFDLAAALLAEDSVELCHPELARQLSLRAAFPTQWHLKRATIGGQTIDAHANVEAAWALSQGDGTTIAIIDDGVDLDHEEFSSAGKIVAPRDATRRTDNPRPGNGDNHGTACAGVACADGRFGSSGVAPRARLMPIRLASALGSQNEADAIVWAAQHGADIISCSWGPADGAWWDRDDPVHGQVAPLPDSTRLALEWAIANGRNGKGCVITWAAGNGSESVDNDGYASYPKVIAVAACNDRGKRSNYSDFGRAIWCAFPSNELLSPRTPGIWTTDRSGAPGYNPGQTSKGDAAGHYIADFGGTSSACPGVAGVAALVIARNPDLRWDEVRDILRRSCDRIDVAGGDYDSTGRSPLYGWGRVNAEAAVKLAVPAQPAFRTIHAALQEVPIPDLKTATLAVEVGDTRPVKTVTVEVDIEHTYIGDLLVRVLPPAGSGVPAVVLHNRAGGSAHNLKKTFDAVSAPDLATLTGKNPGGTWTLEVQDKERQDTGRILRFAVELSL
jgi:subtilisin family serine protease